jgi:potassium-transporting ATPase KdpC subunit
MRRQIVASVRMLLAFTLVTGVVYPLLVTGIAQMTMKHRADGSLVSAGGRVVGSSLIGQAFTGDRWFHGRPDTYDPRASGPTNLGPSNRQLISTTAAAVEALRAQEGLGANASIPADAVTGSGSGLDPDISVAFAQLQAPRVARVRGLRLAGVLALIDQQTQGRVGGILGDPRVNLLSLNVALERLASGP